jgi:hypothetical protein
MQYPAVAWNSYAVLEDIDDEANITGAWETIKDNNNI